MLLAGVFSLKEPIGSMLSEEVKKGIIEHFPDDSTVVISNEEIYFSFLQQKSKIPKSILRA